MTKEEKQKLMNYLYPTDDVLNFMCNDFYQELLAVIPASVCISTKNIVAKTRESNLRLVKNKILEFLDNNKNYSTELKNIYKERALKNKINEFVVGFVFYISCVNEKYDIDIFKSKKSICYSEISLVDVL